VVCFIQILNFIFIQIISKMSKLLLATLSVFIGISVTAQVTMEHVKITDSWIADPADFEVDMNVSVKSLNKPPFPSGEGDKQFLREQKAKSAEMFPRQQVPVDASRDSRAGGESLTVVDSFAVRFFLNDATMVGGTPNDNTMAISNDGKLLASYNSQLWGYDLEADTFLFKASNPHPTFGAFMTSYTDGAGLIESNFDPKLFYHPGRDRFVFLFLTVNRNSAVYKNSATIMAFSSTNNPSDPWYVYRIDGHPFDDGTWADYPQIALNDHSLYFTINQLGGNDWVADFEYTVVWQMDLDDAFSGSSTLNSVVMKDFDYDGKALRYLRPVKTSMGPRDDNMYFISNRPRAITNDSVWLIEMSGEVGSISQPTTKLLVSDTEYGIPPYAKQANGHSFWTNDARALGAVKTQDQIHFVGNTINKATGMAGVYHGIIDDLDDPTLSGHVITDEVLEFGFPNIASMGKSLRSNAMIINFNHTSPEHFAGNAAVYYNDEGEYGPVQLLVEGETYVDMVSQGQDINERWGDYIGLQRKYNETSRAWAAGYVSFSNNRAGTWITEMATPLDGFVGLNDVPSLNETMVFPNPASQKVSFKFTSNSDYLKSSILDINGSLVKSLVNGSVAPGENVISFDIQSLAAGVYFIHVEDENDLIFTEKFVRN